MKKYIKEILISVLLFVITFVLVYFAPLSQFDNTVTDLVYQHPSTINKKIKIIKVDEKTLAEYGPSSEWSRSIPAHLVEALSEEECKPAVITFDIMYIGNKDEAGDKEFQLACEKAGNVITATNIVFRTAVDRFSEGVSYINYRYVDRIEYPYEALVNASDYGFANTIYDKDGYIRQALIYTDYDGERHNSLAFETYNQYQEVVGGDVVIPKLDGKNQTEFTFSGRIGDYEAVSLCDVLNGTVDKRVFKNCIVLVGAYAPGLLDSFNVANQKSSQMYGVEIHANIVEALLEGRFSQPANRIVMGLIMAICAVLFYYLVRKWNLIISLGILIVCIVGELACGIILRKNGISICLIYLPLVFVGVYVYRVFAQYLIERIRRMKTLNAFKKYVAPQIVEELSHKNNLEITLGGENRDIAVLFVDIRGFTTMSESLQPEQVVEILNEYLSLTTKAIFDNKGTLDKFVGDATMAIFNAPFDLDDYIFRAVCAAYDIAAGAEEIEAKMMERFGKKVGFGVGVNCGPAVVGNIGCDVRMDYTAIGDTVNTAARLEANAKSGQILISKAVYEAVKDRIEATPIGEIPLKGKANGFMVYSVNKVQGRSLVLDKQ